MLADARAFLSRSTVTELLIAFGIAGAIFAFVNELVQGWIVLPATQSASSFPGAGPLSFVIDGRVFNSLGIVSSGAALLILFAAAALWVRLNRAALSPNEEEYRDCPHCLSEIPRARPCAPSAPATWAHPPE